MESAQWVNFWLKPGFLNRLKKTDFNLLLFSIYLKQHK